MTAIIAITFFNQKLLVIAVIFAAFIQGLVFHADFLFSNDVWHQL